MLKKYDKQAMGKIPEKATGQEKPATPEQERQMGLFVDAGLQIIRGEEVQQNIIGQTQAEDPVDALAKIVVMVMGRLEDIAQDNGEQIDPDAELHAANVLLGEIMSIYEQNGGQKLTDEQRYQSFSLAVSIYLDDAVKTGKITKEELQQLSSMAQQNPTGQKIAAQMGGGQPPQMQRGQPTQGQMQPKMNPAETGLLG
jgi:hypothetical protein